jgi:hypothetical protein
MTTTFENFNRKNLSALRAEMAKVLQKYGVDANLDISVGNMRFSDAEVEVKVTAKVKGAKTMSDHILESQVKSLGLKMKNAAGDRLVDYKSRNWKFPFVYVDGCNGKRYKCDEQSAKVRFSA